ncbi:MAG: ShlB/FhaC/HecB family hemolysin secretion/activation protein [Pseudomonadota bacterium]
MYYLRFKWFRPKQFAALAVCAIGAVSAWAQVRPDAGTLLAPQLPSPLLPPQSGPQLSLPEPKPAVAGTASVRITPRAFSFVGNSVFSSEELAPLLNGLIDKPTDLAGLTAAVNTVSAYYRSRGYLLTEAYLPEQALPVTGGTITIQVIEARIGRVLVELQGDQPGISKTFAENLVASQLQKGDAVTEYALDKPVLLLRDLAGYEASAIVEPGDGLGEANVRVAVRGKGPRADGSISLDNHGATAAGAVRAVANANINNLLGRGDVLSFSGQLSDQPGSRLYRAGYTLPVGGMGTRLGLNVARLNYALGKQFGALGATGQADIWGLSLSQPLVRGRDTNLYGQVSAEQKRLIDETATPALKSERKIASLRVGLAGNFVDSLAGGTAFNAYALNSTFGRLTLDAVDLALDQGAGGLRTAGAFNKLNLDYQRAQFFGRASSVYFTVQAQLASKNLGSAEKMALGGPNGVRGYPVGEGIGDAGALFSLEYRYQLPPSVSVLSEPVSLLAFYDRGHVRLNQNGPSLPGAANSVNLASVGVGAQLGRAGNFLVKTHLAWRTTPAQPSTGDADRRPRAWLSAQTWF